MRSSAHRRERARMHVTLREGRDAERHFVVALLMLFLILTIVTFVNDRFRENGDRYWLAIVSVLREDFILKSMMIGESMKNMAFWTIYFLTSMLKRYRKCNFGCDKSSLRGENLTFNVIFFPCCR